ncbi:phospholipase D-like domain-containing protein [Sulfitobacter aestuariivivens]|uniref:Phospholipase D n=1 Tax=Sulfitobacter aestuariivivens TaxID=2766981 RepID=A0A927D4T6_9RHOB|nr:phospholipase D-like domain-containing protein [Sulfitobacter aestuariivivens]MBD3665190.1 NgoFVII family restriction endonuclease [Sulfitobacter aestuariivivens]
MFPYHPVVRARSGPYFGAALVGTYSTIIGWDVDDDTLRDGLRGFAIRRTEWDVATQDVIEVRWLEGYKRFEVTDTGTTADVTSLTAPFQRFRWNDYTLSPDRAYRFEVFPMRGDPAAMTRTEAPLVFEFEPTDEDDGDLGVYVNRGVSAAKAYYRRFGDTAPDDVAPAGAAYTWLSRGLRESLVDFIASAQSGDTLHFAVYEFFDLEIAQLIKAAHDRGVIVQLVHDAKKGKHSTDESRHIVHEAHLQDQVIERTTVNISHNKLGIHLRNGTPIKAWAGSANLSENGFNFQTNIAIVVRDPEAVAHYEAYFQNLTGNPTKAKSKDFNTALMEKTVVNTPRFATRTFFSPIRTEDILQTAIDLINGAQSMLLISAPFGVDKDMADAIRNKAGAVVLYGLVNATAQSKVADLRKGPTRIFPPRKLTIHRNERWDAKAFGAHKIHAKTIVIDPYGDNPKVFTGSANFSRASCVDNDENALLVEGNNRLAAIFATEFMRMFDHYKSRFYISETEKENKEIRKQNRIRVSAGQEPLAEISIPIHLDASNRWSRTAFSATANSHKFADRLAFAGRK